MLLFWVVCGHVLPLLDLCRGQDICTPHEGNQQYLSPVLDTLRCHNDYESHVLCSWEEGPHTHTHSHTPLSLYHWDSTERRESQCMPHGQPVLHPNGQTTVQCRYETSLFAIYVNHAFFFRTPCPAAPPPLQHMRIKPVSLSESAVEGGGRLLRWTSPYPPSSPLTPTLIYQVGYRREDQDVWTTSEVPHTQLEVKAESLEPGCRYVARVRAQGKEGLLSEWSPLVAWKTADDPGLGPSSLQCVLDGEMNVTCSWEVKTYLAQFLTYQLSCRHNQTAPAERCCVSPSVSAVPRDPSVLRSSCSLHLRDPRRLLVELIPTYNTKTFQSYKHVRPNRPEHPEVKERKGNWLLMWSDPESPPPGQPSYQVRYRRTESQDDFTYIPGASRPFLLPGGPLHPSQRYVAQVRAQLIRGGRSDYEYEGPPSEWSDPVEWTTNPAPWSVRTLVYVFIGVLVGILFFVLYFTIPACHRRVELWEGSVPSPFKSRVLMDVMKKYPGGWSFPQSERGEKISTCRVESLESHLSRSSPCSSDVPPWFTSDADSGLDHSMTSEGWEDDPGTPHRLAVGKVAPETSGLSFSGPYILCPAAPGKSQSGGDSYGAPSLSAELLPPPSLHEFSVGYVSLPQTGMSRSTEELSRHSGAVDGGGNRRNRDPIALRPESEARPNLGTPAPNGDPPTALTLPTACSTQPSGYCCLPRQEAGGWGELRSAGSPEEEGVSQEALV